MEGAEGMCVKMWSEMMGMLLSWSLSLDTDQFEQLGGHIDRHS